MTRAFLQIERRGHYLKSSDVGVSCARRSLTPGIMQPCSRLIPVREHDYSHRSCQLSLSHLLLLTVLLALLPLYPLHIFFYSYIALPQTSLFKCQQNVGDLQYFNAQFMTHFEGAYWLHELQQNGSIGYSCLSEVS